MSTHETDTSGFSESPHEAAELGSPTLASVLPLLMSPAIAKFAAGVEAVIKSQTALATALERLNAETSRLDSAPSVPAQIDAVEKLKRCRKMIGSVSKMTQNIKARIGAINGYKATIVQHMPELKSVGSSASAAVSCAAAGAPPVDAAAADSIPDAFEADPAPDTSASFHNSSTSSVDSAAALSDVKTMFNVILKAKGVTPYQIIKEVRAITGLGLKEAQDFVESLPKPVKEGLSQDEATAIAAKLKAAGGDVEVD